MFMQTVEDTIVLAFKRGMSFKQVEQRVPAAVAKQLSITEAEFHARLEAHEANFGFSTLVTNLLSKFSRAEQIAIARRK